MWHPSILNFIWHFMRASQDMFLQVKILLSWKCAKPKWWGLYRAKKKGWCIFYLHGSLFLLSNPVHLLCLLSFLFVCITPTDFNGRPAHIRREDNQTLNLFLVWQLNPWVQEILHFMSTCSNIPFYKNQDLTIFFLYCTNKSLTYIWY